MLVGSPCSPRDSQESSPTPQAGIKIAGRNISNLRYADDSTHMAESKEPLDESERGE